MSDNEELLKTSEVARILGITRQTVLKWVTTGYITPKERLPSGHYRYERVEVDRVKRNMQYKDKESLRGVL